MMRTAKVGATCAICGKPLSDPISVTRGIGPECAIKYKQKELADKTGNVFVSRADFTWGLDGLVLWIKDHDNGKSVTNDMEAVLTDIACELGEEVHDLLIMYCDTRNIWDGVTARFQICENEGTFRHNGRRADVSGVDFFSLNETDYRTAKISLLSKANNNAIKSITPNSLLHA